MRKPYIKHLEYRITCKLYGKRYLTVDYIRNGEHHHATFGNIPDYVCDERTIRKYLNS